LRFEALALKSSILMIRENSLKNRDFSPEMYGLPKGPSLCKSCSATTPRPGARSWPRIPAASGPTVARHPLPLAKIVHQYLNAFELGQVGRRNASIPDVTPRQGAQRAILLLLRTQFLPCSYGFQPRPSAHDDRSDGTTSRRRMRPNGHSAFQHWKTGPISMASWRPLWVYARDDRPWKRTDRPAVVYLRARGPNAFTIA
jgi:hypothetical protein